MVWHHSLPLMNSFNKTEAAVFSCRLCFLRAFPFISLMLLGYIAVYLNACITDTSEIPGSKRQEGKYHSYNSITY